MPIYDSEHFLQSDEDEEDQPNRRRCRHIFAHNNIDLKRAGMLLYSLQISTCTLPPHPRPAPLNVANHTPLKDIVEDLI